MPQKALLRIGERVGGAGVHALHQPVFVIINKAILAAVDAQARLAAVLVVARHFVSRCSRRQLVVGVKGEALRLAAVVGLRQAVAVLVVGVGRNHCGT